MKTLAAMNEHDGGLGSPAIPGRQPGCHGPLDHCVHPAPPPRRSKALSVTGSTATLRQAKRRLQRRAAPLCRGLLRAVDQGLAQDVLPLLIASTEYQHIASFDAGTALVAALAGDRDTAGAGLKRLVASGFQGAPRGADWLAPTAFLAHACALIGARDEAPALYDSLSRTAATAVRVGPMAGWWGPVDHHLGCLAWLIGRPDEAEQRLRRALQVEDRMGARPFAARTLARLASVLAENAPQAARAAGDDAMATAKAVGASGVIAEVEMALAAGR